MNSSINLVRAQDRENLQRRKKIFILRAISITFISFVGIVSIILFILYARISVSSIKKEQALAAQNIVLQKDKLAKLNLLNDRLRGIKEILKERKNYTTTLNSLLEQVPVGATTSSLSINKSSVSLTVTSSSLLPINKFLNNIVDLYTKKHLIREIVIESLTVDTRSGTYSLSVKAKTI